MFFLRGRLYKFTFLIHAMDRRSEIRRILEEIISEDSERNSRDNRDNSGNRPHTSVSGEHAAVNYSHLDVQSQPTSQTRLCMYFQKLINNS